MRIPDDDHVLVEGQSPQVPGGGCFTVTVNEMRLGFVRAWAKTYEPMVLAVCDFRYDGATRSTVSVVGASALVNSSHDTPPGHGFHRHPGRRPAPLLRSARVTMILYRVLHEDYARAALGVLQKICHTVDLSGAVATAVEIGEAVLDGVDAAFGHGQIEPMLGYRIEHNGQLRPGSYALLAKHYQPEGLWLETGELKSGNDNAGLVAVDHCDHVTYTVAAAPAVDLNTLPWFKPLWRRIVQWANIPTDPAKDVTKNYLAALYEEIAASPDVPRDGVEELYTQWENVARSIHQTARDRRSWGTRDATHDQVQERALAIREAW